MQNPDPTLTKPGEASGERSGSSRRPRTSSMPWGKSLRMSFKQCQQCSHYNPSFARCIQAVHVSDLHIYSRSATLSHFLSIYADLYIYIYTIYIYIYIYLCMYVCMCVCMYVFIYVCICICICICVLYVYVYVYRYATAKPYKYNN